MPGLRLERVGELEHLALAARRETLAADNREFAGRERAGLIEGDRIDPRESDNVVNLR